MLESKEIQQIIPHRYPFLLVDRIIELEEGKRAVGIKMYQEMSPFSKAIFQAIPLCRVF